VGERQFGPYRLVRQVAVGGMAEIHLAKTRGIAGFEKYVALKMIHPNFAEDDAFIQMLIDEAKIAVQLQHVNIAQTFDLGRVGDNYYITMEYVDGADLYKILRRGSEQERDVPLDVCAFVAKEVAAGLDYAHRKKDMAGTPLGIVHRDVSPQNVLISNAGEVKLVDFGIAKATMKVRQTAAGVIKGKYYYMSPEQAWGDKVDHRSDIFSAGIVLYEMMTGQMLYLEEDLHHLMDMVRKADIAPPTVLRPDVPPQLERIVMRALARQPEDRYQVAADLANDLEKFLHSYSPVFTATKLAKHVRTVMGEPVPIGSAPEIVHDDPVISTLEISDAELLHDRAELRDENSVIFRLQAQQQRAPTPTPTPVPAPLPRAPSAPVAVAPPVRAPSAPPVRPPTAPVVRPKMEIPRITQRQPGGTQPPPMGAPAAGGGGGLAPMPPMAASGPVTAIAPAPPPEPVPVRPVATPVPRPRASVPSAPVRPRDPNEETRPVDARMLAASTWNMDDDGDDDAVEHTVISAPPSMTNATTQDGATPGYAAEDHRSERTLDLGTDDVSYEPTMIEQNWSGSGATTADLAGSDSGGVGLQTTDDVIDDDDHPTLAPLDDEPRVPRVIHAPAVPRPASREADTTRPARRSAVAAQAQVDAHDDEEGPTMMRGPAVRAPAPASTGAVPRRTRSGNPALTASTPTPAVSELRKPARSRKTPAGGVGPQPSVLQAIVGAAGSEPMPSRPPPPNATAPTASMDAVYPEQPQPHQHQPPHAQQPYHQQQPHQQQHQQPPTHPHQQSHHGQQPHPHEQSHHGQQPQYPQQHPVPVPAHLQPYAGGWPQQQPYAGLPSQVSQVAGQPYAFQPYGQPPPSQPTFTQQMRAVIELDEIPSQYKVARGPRWLGLVVAALVAVAGAAAITYFILRRKPEPVQAAVLRIDSVPAGATVLVDGAELPQKTPVPFTATKPGARHTIKVSLAGYRPYQDEVVLPSTGGEYRISPVLVLRSGKITINTIPGGADIYIKGEPRGTTPRVLTDLEIASTTELELRLRDYPPRTIPLVWPESGEIDLNIDFKK
jgi:serine/threonine protein kinase